LATPCRKKEKPVEAEISSMAAPSVGDVYGAEIRRSRRADGFCFPRGTSSYAFDGSGPLSRSQNQYELATFSSGKRYNCDLSASYNIGARYWAMKLKLIHRKDGQVLSGRSSGNSPRIPVTLSTLWLWSDAPHQCAI